MKTYALLSQLIIEIIVLAALGYFIGYKINPDGVLKGVLAVIGTIIGIIFMIVQVITYGRRKQNNKN